MDHLAGNARQEIMGTAISEDPTKIFEVLRVFGDGDTLRVFGDGDTLRMFGDGDTLRVFGYGDTLPTLQ